MNVRTLLIASLLALTMVQLVPAPALAVPPCAGSVVSGGLVWLWIPGVNGTNCVGAWAEPADGVICTAGVGPTSVHPVYVSGGRGFRCPVGAAVVLP
jgi:hypothetical protein